MALAIQERTHNSFDVLYGRYLGGDQLTAGQMTKILHRLPPGDQIRAREETHAAQRLFWRKWSSFRGGLEQDRECNFYHVVARLPVLPQFARFVNPKEGDLILDLAGGSAAMAAYFNRSEIAGYASIDSNPLVQSRAKIQLMETGHPSNHAILHDLSKGLPEELDSIVASVKPARIRSVSNWGITYLDIESMASLMHSVLDPDINRGAPAKLDVNMLTNGRFDPEVLRKKFMREIVPQHLIKGQFRPLLKAFRALPQIRRFGSELPEVVPVWYPEEIENLLDERGLTVVRKDQSLLWGQSTAMEVCKKVA